MALAVCLLLDEAGERAVRRLWRRIEEAGLPSLARHTHGRHVPHLTYAMLRTYDREAVTAGLAGLPDAGPTTLYLDALGLFRRSRCWLAPAAVPGLTARQAAVVSRSQATGADLHRHYRPGVWVPHLGLAPRLHLGDLPIIAGVVYDVLPITVRAVSAALVETSTGDLHRLPHPV